MKRSLLGLILLAAVAWALPSDAAVYRVLNAVTTTGASASVDTSNAKYVRVQVFSATTSSATVTIEQSLNGSVWITVATITDPDGTGKGYTVPSLAFTRVNVTARTSGTITADVEVQRP